MTSDEALSPLPGPYSQILVPPQWRQSFCLKSALVGSPTNDQCVYKLWKEVRVFGQNPGHREQVMGWSKDRSFKWLQGIGSQEPNLAIFPSRFRMTSGKAVTPLPALQPNLGVPHHRWKVWTLFLQTRLILYRKTVLSCFINSIAGRRKRETTTLRHNNNNTDGEGRLAFAGSPSLLDEPSS